MASKGQRSAEPVMEVWEEGDYTLTVDRFTTAKAEHFLRGDLLHLDEGEASRLGNSGAIAPVGSMEGRKAQASAIEDDGERRTRMLLLQAEEMEERAQKLRESVGAGGE